MSDDEDASAQAGQLRRRNGRSANKKTCNPDRDAWGWEFGKAVCPLVNYNFSPYHLLVDVAYLKSVTDHYVLTFVYVPQYIVQCLRADQTAVNRSNSISLPSSCDSSRT
jgi:hypothetical protein